MQLHTDKTLAALLGWMWISTAVYNPTIAAQWDFIGLSSDRQQVLLTVGLFGFPEDAAW